MWKGGKLKRKTSLLRTESPPASSLYPRKVQVLGLFPPIQVLSSSRRALITYKLRYRSNLWLGLPPLQFFLGFLPPPPFPLGKSPAPDMETPPHAVILASLWATSFPSGPSHFPSLRQRATGVGLSARGRPPGWPPTLHGNCIIRG